MNKVQFSHDKPPIFERISKVFPIDWERVIITYGDTVYSKHPISVLKIRHETIHTQQQVDKDSWWDRYLSDPKFRLLQEVEAYQAEAKLARTTIKDNNLLYRYIDAIARDLSSPMYGGIISYSDAKRLLK